jgi:hypothetical protein
VSGQSRADQKKNRKTGPSDDFRLLLNIFRVAPNGGSVMGNSSTKIPAAIRKKEEEEVLGGGDSRA